MILTWNVEPELVTFGSFAIRWYGVLFASSFIGASYLMRWFFIRENKPEKYVETLLIYSIIGVVVGARLGHTLFYEPGYYLSHPLEILKIWKGGLASHGAGVGLFTVLYFYSKKVPGQSYLWILDRVSIGVASSGVLIRSGNFFNSEIIGKPTGGDWGIIFKKIDSLARHPAQLYEGICYLMIFIFLMVLYKTPGIKERKGLLLGIFLVAVFTSRFFIEFFKENQVGFEEGMFLNMGQLLSIPVILLGLGFILIQFIKTSAVPTVEKTSEPVKIKNPPKKNKKGKKRQK
ncbi:MAG: prolipoprotein diacylglyceryl transferase [Deltaproteobacteria bacterium]|nr:prolipoprotein diacylglyceryl transferase [Deltaproteobacteria bacterium]